jgi:hypothetical protein
MPDLNLADLLATVTATNPLPWRLVDRTESGKDTDADRDVLDANGQVVTWIDGRSAPAALLVAAVNTLPNMVALAEGHETEVAEYSIDGYCCGCDPSGYARAVLALGTGHA